jgi:hypothetical protein
VPILADIPVLFSFVMQKKIPRLFYKPVKIPRAAKQRGNGN